MYNIWKSLIPPTGKVVRIYETQVKTQGFRTRFSNLFVPYAEAFYINRVNPSVLRNS